MAKTGFEQVLRLSPQTVAAIREIYDPKAKRVWLYGCHPRRLFFQLGQIVDMAGLPNGRLRKFHCLRKTCATLTAAAGRLDLAQSTLGHTNGYMTRNYIDQRAAPSASAADVLPRPVFGNARPSVETSPPPTETPNGDTLAALSMSPPLEGESAADNHPSQSVATASSGSTGRNVADVLEPGSFSASLATIAALPLSNAEAVRRIMAEMANQPSP